MQIDDCAESDRREVNPPIEVESATLSAAGTLDWWGERAAAVVGPGAVQMVVRSGSKLLTFVRRKRADREFTLSFVVLVSSRASLEVRADLRSERRSRTA